MNFVKQQVSNTQKTIALFLVLQFLAGEIFATTPLVMSQNAIPFEYEEYLKSSSRFVSLTESVRSELNSQTSSPQVLSWIQRQRKICAPKKGARSSDKSKEITEMIFSRDWNRAERAELRLFFREIPSNSPCYATDLTLRKEINYALGSAVSTPQKISGNPVTERNMDITDRDAIFLNGREISLSDWSNLSLQHGRLMIVSNSMTTRSISLETALNDTPAGTPFAKGSCAAPWFNESSIEQDHAVFYSPDCVWIRRKGKWSMQTSESEGSRPLEAAPTIQSLNLPPTPKAESSSSSSNAWWIAAGAVVLGVVAYGLVSQNQRRGDSNSSSGTTQPTETVIRR